MYIYALQRGLTNLITHLYFTFLISVLCTFRTVYER